MAVRGAATTTTTSSSSTHHADAPSAPPEPRLSSRALPVSHDDDDDGDDTAKKSRYCCCFQHPCCFVLLIVLLVTAGGVMIWKLLPDATKETIQDFVPTTSIGNANATRDNVTTSTHSHQESSTGSSSSSSSSSSTTTTSILGTPPTFDYYRCDNYDESNCCNGVDTICDLRVNDVMFAGLHNAYASIEDGFLFGSGNHEYSLEYGLQAGFRAINLDLGRCHDELALVHGKCELGRRDPFTVFSHMQLFLDKHPRELLLVPIEVNHDAGGGAVDLWEFDATILQSVSGLTDRLYRHNETLQWPTMRQLIDSDQRIILFVYNTGDVSCRDVGACPPGLQDWFLYAAESVYGFASVDALSDTTTSCPYDRGSLGYSDFYALNMFVSNPLPSKASSAVINEPAFLQAHLQACQSDMNRNVSVVFVDFWEEGNLVDLVQTHNQQLSG